MKERQSFRYAIGLVVVSGVVASTWWTWGVFAAGDGPASVKPPFQGLSVVGHGFPRAAPWAILTAPFQGVEVVGTEVGPVVSRLAEEECRDNAMAPVAAGLAVSAWWRPGALAAGDRLTAVAASVILSGAESESPWIRHTIDDSSRGADGVRLADVNGDGLLDIATGWEEGGLIRMYLNPGRSKVKQKWPAVTVGKVGSPEDAVFVDLDGDGAVDVVSCCEGRVKSMYVHWSPKDPAKRLDPGSWKTHVIPVTKGAKSWMFCVPMEVDGKNGIDLIAGAKGGNAEIGWLESPRNPRDLAGWKWHPIRKAGWIMSLYCIDMDGDGDLDILVSDRKGSARSCFWLENPGRSTVQTGSWKEHYVGGRDREVMFIVPSDLDGDGLFDVLAAIAGHELMYWRRVSKDGLTWESSSIQLPAAAGNGKAVNVGDVNLHGKPDIVFTCEGAGKKSGVMWMSYRKSATDARWDAHDISGPEGTKYDLVQLLDLDADGDLDALTCEEKENLGVIWYENPTKRQRRVRPRKPEQEDVERVPEHVRRVQAMAQVAVFMQALDEYYIDTGTLPTKEEGLRVLVESPPDSGAAASWQGPYLRSLTKDPWGNDYHYRVPGIDGTDYDIISYGRDGIEGGEGPDADISNHDLRNVDE